MPQDQHSVETSPLRVTRSAGRVLIEKTSPSPRRVHLAGFDLHDQGVETFGKCRRTSAGSARVPSLAPSLSTK